VQVAEVFSADVIAGRESLLSICQETVAQVAEGQPAFAPAGSSTGKDIVFVVEILL
jgi:hypothetical protein